MDSRWLKGLEDKDKESFRRKLVGAKKIFSKQKEIIDADIEKELHKMLSEEDFEKASWAELQAYRNGKIKAYKDVISLINNLTN